MEKQSPQGNESPNHEWNLTTEHLMLNKNPLIEDINEAKDLNPLTENLKALENKIEYLFGILDDKSSKVDQ